MCGWERIDVYSILISSDISLYVAFIVGHRMWIDACFAIFYVLLLFLLMLRECVLYWNYLEFVVYLGW